MFVRCSLSSVRQWCKGSLRLLVPRRPCTTAPQAPPPFLRPFLFRSAFLHTLRCSSQLFLCPRLRFLRLFVPHALSQQSHVHPQQVLMLACYASPDTASRSPHGSLLLAGRVCARSGSQSTDPRGCQLNKQSADPGQKQTVWYPSALNRLWLL